MSLGFGIVAKAPGSCFLQEGESKRRSDSGKSFIASRTAAAAWVRSLSLTSLWSRLKAEPKDLAVSPKPRTAAKLVSPGLGTVLWISSSWGGAVPFGWARPRLLSSEFSLL